MATTEAKLQTGARISVECTELRASWRRKPTGPSGRWRRKSCGSSCASTAGRCSVSGDCGAGSVTERGGKWRVRLSVNGDRHHFTIEADTEKAAQEWAKAKPKELKRDARLANMDENERRGAILEAAAELGLPADALAELAKREERHEPVKLSELLTEFEEKHLRTVFAGVRRS